MTTSTTIAPDDLPVTSATEARLDETVHTERLAPRRTTGRANGPVILVAAAAVIGLGLAFVTGLFAPIVAFAMIAVLASLPWVLCVRELQRHQGELTELLVNANRLKN
jgi:Flp pilus assembly protein TadB